MPLRHSARVSGQPSFGMSKLTATITAGIVLALILATLHLDGRTGPKVNVPSLCTTDLGRPFVIADELRGKIAVHAGQFLGISFAALNTGEPEGQISVPQLVFAASMPPGTGILTVAEDKRPGIRVSNFNVTYHTANSTQLFVGLTAQLAVFTPDGKYLLGVTAFLELM